MILEKDGKIFHDEHDITVKVSNDNTKHEKTVSVTIRSDGDVKDVMKVANDLFKEYRD